MSGDAIVHIGMPRTGTTSIQRALEAARSLELKDAGLTFPEGFIVSCNHLEIPLYAMRPNKHGRLTDHLAGQARSPLNHLPISQWAEPIRASLGEIDTERIVVSSETLSNLRFADEVERVLYLLDAFSVSVVVAFRSLSDWLESYEWAANHMWFGPSKDPDSATYIGPGAWITDYDAKVDLWESVVGRGRVHVIDYDAAVEQAGSVVPPFFRLIGAEPPQRDVTWFHGERTR